MLTFFIFVVVFFVRSDVNDVCGDENNYCVKLGNEVLTERYFNNVTSAVFQIDLDFPSGFAGEKKIVLVGNSDGSEQEFDEEVVIDGVSPSNTGPYIIEVYRDHEITWTSSTNNILTFTDSSDWVIRNGHGALKFKSDSALTSMFDVTYKSGRITFGPFDIEGDGGPRIASILFANEFVTGGVTFKRINAAKTTVFTESLFLVDVTDMGDIGTTSDVTIDSCTFDDVIPVGKYLIESEAVSIILKNNYVNSDANIFGHVKSTNGEVTKVENNVFYASGTIDEACVDIVTTNFTWNDTLYMTNNLFDFSAQSTLVYFTAAAKIGGEMEIRNNLVNSAANVFVAAADVDVDCEGDFSFNSFNYGTGAEADVYSTACAATLTNSDNTFGAAIPWEGSAYDRPFPYYKLSTLVAGTATGMIPTTDIRGLTRQATPSQGPYEYLCDGLCGYDEGRGFCNGLGSCGCLSNNTGDTCQCLFSENKQASAVSSVCECRSSFFEYGSECRCSNASNYWYPYTSDTLGPQCACNATFVISGDRCVCSVRMVQSGHACKCDDSRHYIPGGAGCICDSSENWVENDAGNDCVCDVNYDLDDESGECLEKKSGLSAAAIAGIAIGCVVGCAACCAVIIVICFILAVIFIEVIKQLRHSKHLSLGLFSGGGGGKDDGDGMDDDNERNVSTEIDRDDGDDGDDDSDDDKRDDDSGEGDSTEESD